MRALQFGVAAGCPDLATYREWAQVAEASGFDLLGYGDSQCLIPELSVALAAMAGVTTRSLLCPTVSNPVTRHPTVAASAFSALQELSEGRTRFCLGSGDSAALSVGARPSSLAELEAYATAVRGLTRGETVSYHGRELRLEWRTRPVPVWIAAGGPRTMALAGRVADGVLLGAGLSEDVVRDAVGRVRGAAEDAGRDPDDVEIWIFSKIYLCESEEQAWHDLAWTLAASAHHAFRFTLEGKFVPEQYAPALRALHEQYVVREHNNLANTGRTNADLVRETGLTDFLGPRFLLAGPPSRVQERIVELASWGVTGFFTSAMFGAPIEATRRIGEDVITPLRAAGR
jgi:5,10-methylenetetrahydromethanopterin reductase